MDRDHYLLTFSPFGCANRLGILIQSANLASPGAFWPYIRFFGCAKRLEILIQSANLASPAAILGELVALEAQTGVMKVIQNTK